MIIITFFQSQLESAIDIQVEEAQKLGMRVVLTRGSMSLGEKDGGLPPQSVVQTKEQILSDSERLIKTHHDAKRGRNDSNCACSMLSLLSKH